MNANSTYPLIHEAMIPLIADWLKYKRSHGSVLEVAMYKDMGLIQLVQRLLEHRAVAFVGPRDKYMLIDKNTGAEGWEYVGTDQEKEPLVSIRSSRKMKQKRGFEFTLVFHCQVLTKCLSYDEIKLSAMMTMSSHTEFINDGSRDNKGVVSSDPEAIQPRGVIIGVIGSR